MGGANSKGQEKTLCIQLHNAIVNGNESAARELLLCGAVSPNNKLFIHSRKLVLPLFTAIENNCLSLVEVLLQYDASTSTFNREGDTPLHMATSQNLIEVVETLFRYQADPCALNAHGETALHIAATYGLVSMASLLIRSGASTNLPGKHLRTPLHSACAIPGNTNMIMALLDNGVDPDALDEDGRAPLHYLAQLGNTGGIDILAQAGANKNTADAAGKTPLHITVENQEVQATIAMIRHQCDVNWQDNSGLTPLHKAVKKEYGELVSLLLQHGADTNLSSTKAICPLRSTVLQKNLDIAQKLLLCESTRVNACGVDGITPLHVACLYGIQDIDDDMEMVELLLNKGANVNAQCAKKGRTPLHNAVEAKMDEFVRLLLRHGADTTICDSKGRTAAATSTVEAITTLLESATSHSSHGSSGERSPVLTRRIDVSINRANGTARRTNLYTPPTARSNRINQSNPFLDNGIDANGPPPLPPRDSVTPFGQQPNLNFFGSPPHTFPTTNIIRHEFVWSSLDNNTQCNSSQNPDATSKQVKVDGTSSTKLLNFPTTFGGDKSDPQTVCYSVLRSGQLINTKLGCLLNVEPGAVKSNLLLYVDAIGYSPNVLELPTSYRLCSNIIHFYTHFLADGISVQCGDQPEREVPHFSKPVLVEFPLRKSAINLYDERENEIKVLVSYDEGSSWEETSSRIEKVYMENHSIERDSVHFAVTETDELGMYAVVLCPKEDMKKITTSGEKIVSSVDPSVSVSVDTGHTEDCRVEMIAENVKSSTIEALQAEDFPYVVGCSRQLTLRFINGTTTSNITYSASVHLLCSMFNPGHGGDISYRVLKKQEEPLNRGWCAVVEGKWLDITQKACKQLQISGRTKRLLSSAASHSPHHVSFTVSVDSSMQSSFLVVAVRSFSHSLTNHLTQLPHRIEKLQSATSLSFLVNQKASRLSVVTCDIRHSKDTDKRFQDNGSYIGPPPSSPKIVHERECINIGAVGGIKTNGNVSRNVVFNSAMLPFSEQFTIKGRSNTANTSEHFVGSFEFSLKQESSESEATLSATSNSRPPLSSESSVLVMENRAFNDQPPSQSESLQELEKNLLASLPLKLPRKRPLKTLKTASPDVVLDKTQLSNEILHLICRDLDVAELKELAFQLDISKSKIEGLFKEHKGQLEKAGIEMLRQWSSENHAFNQDAIPSLCDALSCVGRERLSEDVARRCNPFVLDDLGGLAPLPELPLETVVPDFPDSFVNGQNTGDFPAVATTSAKRDSLGPQPRPL